MHKYDQIRPLLVELEINQYAEGSALISMGNTKVLCTATVEASVPKWLEGSGKGWVTAEYSMLPRSTHTRMRRERDKVGGRTLEIQRLVARSLRACVDLEKLGERSIIVDCDVLQADGGTRTASINGGCIALAKAIEGLIKKNGLSADAWIQTVAGISIGMKDGKVLTDLDYDADSTCDVDMNFVITSKGEFVEIQGTAEKATFTQEHFTEMNAAAISAAKAIHQIQVKNINL